MFIKDGFNGFYMALADSVPGVSGGTVAFVMGFYDQFIGSINDVVFGKMKEKQQGLRYLVKLGIGWAIGMGLAVVILSALFESHIYAVSSLFIGFIAGAIPLIMREEKECVKEVGKGILFGVLGALLVAGHHLGQWPHRCWYHEPGSVFHRPGCEALLHRAWLPFPPCSCPASPALRCF